MVAKRSISSEELRDSSIGFDAEDTAPQWVIQRTGETVREWWTGSGWSEEADDALKYSEMPDVSIEAQDESARAIKLDEVDD